MHLHLTCPASGLHPQMSVFGALFIRVRGRSVLRSSLPSVARASTYASLSRVGINTAIERLCSPTFDKLGSHTHATTPCSGRVRDCFWPATITVTGGWMHWRYVYLCKVTVLLCPIQGRMEGMSKTVV